MPKRESESYPEERKWPPRPGNDLTCDEATTYLSQFTPEQQSHTLVYVWRTWPVIHRVPKFIDKVLPKDLTYRYMIDTHGGGKYKFAIYDTDNREKQIIFRLDIPITDAMPKLKYSELDLGHPDNKTYVDRLIAEGVINEHGEPIVDQIHRNEVQAVVGGMQSIVQQLLNQLQEARKANNIDETTLQKAMDLLSTAYQKAIDTAVGSNSGKISEMTEVLRFAQSLMAQAQGSGTSQILEQMLRMQADMYKSQIELLTKISETRSGTDWIDQLAKIREAFGLRIGPERSAVPSTIETILKYGAPIVSSLERIITNALQVKRGLPPAAVTAQEPVVQSPEDPAQSIIRNYGQLVLNALARGDSGTDFAFQIIDLFGLQVHAAIAAFGAEKIIEAAKSVPEFAAQIHHIMPRFEQFVHDFINAPNQEQTDGTEVP